MSNADKTTVQPSASEVAAGAPGSTLSTHELHVLRHSLGLTRSKEPYRNYFCTGPGSDDYACCEGLVAKGLMTRRRDPLNEMSEDYIFHVTDAGKLAASNARTDAPQGRVE